MQHGTALRRGPLRYAGDDVFCILASVYYFSMTLRPPVDHILDLPPEMFMEIIKHIDADVVVRVVQLVCRKFRTIIENEGYWKSRLQSKCQHFCAPTCLCKLFIYVLNFCIYTWARPLQDLLHDAYFWRNAQQNFAGNALCAAKKCGKSSKISHLRQQKIAIWVQKLSKKLRFALVRCILF